MNRRATAILFFCLTGLLPATGTVFAGEPPCPPEPALDRALHKTLLDAHKAMKKKTMTEPLARLTATPQAANGSTTGFTSCEAY